MWQHHWLEYQWSQWNHLQMIHFHYCYYYFLQKRIQIRYYFDLSDLKRPIDFEVAVAEEPQPEPLIDSEVQHCWDYLKVLDLIAVVVVLPADLQCFVVV